MKKLLTVSICLLTLGLFAGCGSALTDNPLWDILAGGGEAVVGKDIVAGDITEFYYTISSSTNPPEYQRYRFSVEDGKHLFYHETREGDHWPLTEDDVTVSGTKELSDEEWESFFACLKDGTVKKREEDTSSGGRGPWLYLYWNGDQGEYQEFSFSSWDAESAFEELCVSLKEASGS